MAIRVGISDVEEVEGTTYYIIALQGGGDQKSWEVKKRFSSLYTFYSQIAHECTSMLHPFPPKKLGKLNAEAAARRRSMLDSWLKEVMETMLTMKSKQDLYTFLEVPDGCKPPFSVFASKAPATLTDKEVIGGNVGHEDEASITITAPPPPPPAPTPSWSNDFLINDPLAILSLEDPVEASKRNNKNQQEQIEQQPKQKIQVEKKTPPRPNVSSQSSATSTLMTATSKKSDYPVTGEGLRTAIMEKDAAAVSLLLSKDSSLALYRDRQACTMLHLAGIFGLTDIALALVENGPMTVEEWPCDSRNESILDVMPPSLKTKVLAAFKRKQEGATAEQSTA